MSQIDHMHLLPNYQHGKPLVKLRGDNFESMLPSFAEFFKESKRNLKGSRGICRLFLVQSSQSSEILVDKVIDLAAIYFSKDANGPKDAEEIAQAWQSSQKMEASPKRELKCELTAAENLFPINTLSRQESFIEKFCHKEADDQESYAEVCDRIMDILFHIAQEHMMHDIIAVTDKNNIKAILLGMLAAGLIKSRTMAEKIFWEAEADRICLNSDSIVLLEGTDCGSTLLAVHNVHYEAREEEYIFSISPPY